MFSGFQTNQRVSELIEGVKKNIYIYIFFLNIILSFFSEPASWKVKCMSCNVCLCVSQLFQRFRSAELIFMVSLRKAGKLVIREPWSVKYETTVGSTKKFKLNFGEKYTNEIIWVIKLISIFS